MDTVSLENRVLEEAQSSELAACFQIIQEASVDDVDKYPEKICRELARAVVCRTYASAVHELCHLVVAAAGSDPTGRYENLFWNTGPARARNFHAWFQRAGGASRHIAVEPAQIVLRYGDKPFAVTYGRMPFLSALMEFLMTALGYTELDDSFAPLCAAFPDAKGVSDAANELSRKLYAYLQDHLPPVQEQRRHRDFLGFIAERADGGAAAQAIDDEAVIEYWLEHAADDEAEAGTDARTYRGVFKTAVRLLHILRLAADKHGMSVALPIGTEREAGEVDPADVESAMAEIDEAAEPITMLEETAASGVKFLNKRELDTLRQALHGEAAGRCLTRSVLRNAVFGDAQARLTQALRQGIDGATIAQRIADEPDHGYDARIDAFAALAPHLARMGLIAFHVLAQAGHRDAVNAALAVRPDLDLADLADALDGGDAEHDDANVVSFQAERAMQRFFQSAHGADPADAIGALAVEAAKAAKGFARQGFSEDATSDPNVIELFAAALPALTALRRELDKFIGDHAAGIDWAAQMDADTPRFRAQFLRLYGDRNA